MALAMVCSSIVLPVRGAATMSARWPLPSGSMRSRTRVERFVGRRLQPDAVRRVERGQVVEEDLVLRAVGRLEVDRVHLDEREVALVLLGRADLAADGVAGAQVELADLRGRDVDVVRARAGSSTRARAGTRSRRAGSRARPPRRSALPSPPGRAGSGRPAPASSWRAPGISSELATWASLVMPISFRAARSRRRSVDGGRRGATARRGRPRCGLVSRAAGPARCRFRRPRRGGGGSGAAAVRVRVPRRWPRARRSPGRAHARPWADARAALAWGWALRWP